MTQLLEQALPLPVYQAVVDRRRKVLVLPASVGRLKRHDGVRVVETLNGEETGQWCLARVTWSEVTEDERWNVVSVEVVTPTLKGIGPLPSDEVPTRPDLPRVQVGRVIK
jgi:hypothetical protein